MLNKEQIKNNKFLLLMYRLTAQFIDVRKSVQGLWRYPRFLTSYLKYRRMEKTLPVFVLDWYPQIHDRTSTTRFDPHYFYQGYWAFKRIRDSGAKRHLDIGSQIDLVRYLSVLMPVTFVDIRPLMVVLQNFESKAGSILDLPYDHESWNSVSCLHVIEHIGLGRYGDPLDALGSEKAARELSRILARGGKFISVNSHWQTEGWFQRPQDTNAKAGGRSFPRPCFVRIFDC